MIDTVDLDVLGGRGGDGAVSFRREKFVPRGGPDGGDGGRGGNVIIVATRSLSTLRDFHDGRVRRAEDGKAGGPQRKRGASGKSLTLRVPIGCVVRVASVGGDDALDEPEYLADLALDGMSVIVARGGRGGLGNTRFATSTRQAPKFAQRGQPGASVQLRLELKLLADVGLVGLPNAGKSTLLRAWSAAQPKVGAYPFTTLEPELGVVSVGYDTFVAADMPGLIEGASQGAGLGHEFLRHIERTQVLVHLLDMSREDPVADRALIDAELAAFGHGLADKPQLLALNKVDQPDARARAELLIESGAIREPYLLLSGLTGEGARELAAQAWRLVQGVREAERATVAEELPVLEPPARRERFRVERPDEGPPVVRGSTPEWLAATFNLDDQDARFEFFDRLKKLGVGRALHRVGVEEGDPVRVGDVEVAWDV